MISRGALKQSKIFWLIVVAIILAYPALKMLFYDKAHIDEAVNQYTVNDQTKGAYSLNSLSSDSKDQSRKEIIDNDETTAWSGFSNEKSGNEVVVVYSQKVSVDKVYVNFGSQYPIDFDVEIADGNGWRSIDQIRSNEEVSYTGYYSNISTDQIRLKFYRTNSGIIGIFDFYSLRVEEKRPIIESSFNLLFQHSRSTGAYFYYSFLFFIVILLSGSLVFKPFRGYSSEDEMPVFSFAAGLIFLAFVGLLGVLFRSFLDNKSVIIVLSFVWIAICIEYSDINLLLRQMKRNRTIYLISLFYLIFVICWTSVFDNKFHGLFAPLDFLYDNSRRFFLDAKGFYFSDQLFPFNVTKYFLYGINNISANGREWFMVNYYGRPQFFALATVPIASLFGDRFFVFQAFTISSISLLLASSFFLIKQLFDRKTAFLTIAFLILNSYLLYIYQLMQVKLVATFFVLLFLSCLVRYKNTHDKKALSASSVLIAIAIMTHTFTLSYLIVGVFYLVPNPLNWWKERNILLRLCALPITIFGMWFVYSYASGGLSFLKSIVVADGSTVGLGRKAKLIANLNAKYYNFLGLFITSPIVTIWDRSVVVGFFRSTLTGALSLTLLIPTALGIFISNKRKLLLSFFLIPLFFGLMSHSFYALYGIQLFAIPSITILVAFAAYWLQRSQIISRVVLLLACLEWVYVNFVVYHREVLDPLLGYFGKNPSVGFASFVIFFLPVFISVLIASEQIIPAEGSK